MADQKRVNVQGFGVVNFPANMSDGDIATAIERDIMPQVRAKQAAAIADDKAVIEAREASKPGAFARVGRGMMDTVQGAKQLFFRGRDALQGTAGSSEETKQYEREMIDEMNQYEADRQRSASPSMSQLVTGEKPDAGFDWLRLGGNVASTLPVGFIPGGAAASMPARIASMTAQGAASAAVQPVDTDKGDFASQKALQTGIGAVVAPVAGEAVRKGAEVVGNRVFRPARDFISSTVAKARGEAPNPNAVVNAAGELTEAGKAALEKTGVKWSEVGDEAREGLKQLASSATKEARAMTPEQQLRKVLIKEVTGEEATLGQVTRDFAQQQTEHDLKKINSVGMELRARFAKQNKGIQDSIENLRKGTGGVAADEYAVGHAVADSVKKADKEAKDAVSMLYQAIDQEKGGKFGGVPKAMLEKLDEISSNAEGDTITQSVLRRLRRIGIVAEETNTGLKFDKFDKPFTAKDFEELRKFVGGLDTSSPNKRRMVAQLVDALDRDVRREAGEDVYEIARGVAKTRFEDLNIPAVRAVVDGDIKPEQLFDRFVRKGGIDDLEALKGYMSRGAHDPHGTTAAWNELRGQALKHVFEKGMKQSARDELDNVVFSGPMFKKELEAMGRRKLEVLFTPEELAKLDKIVKVAEWRVPMADVLNTSNTNSAWWNMLDKMLSYLPGRTGMVLRGTGRAAKIGAEDIANEAAAKAAVNPSGELARRAEEEATGRVAEGARSFVSKGRAPSFFSIGTEKKRD